MKIIIAHSCHVIHSFISMCMDLWLEKIHTVRRNSRKTIPIVVENLLAKHHKKAAKTMASQKIVEKQPKKRDENHGDVDAAVVDNNTA